MENNNSVEKILDLTEEEKQRLRELLYGFASDIANETSWGSWEGELGAFQDTEMEELFDDGLEEVERARENLSETLFNCWENIIPTTIDVSEDKYEAILKERKEKAVAEAA